MSLSGMDGPYADLTHEIIGAAMKVHTALGPGLLESVYEKCLARELTKRGRQVQRQAEVPVIYDGEVVECGFRADLIVDGCVLLELKAVEAVLPIHEAQLFTYLRLTGIRLGLLINFNVRHLKDGVRRRVL